MPLVPFRNRAPLGQMKIHLFHLRQTNRSLNVGHPVVITHHGKPIATLWIHSLTAEETHLFVQRSVLSNNHPAFARCNDLIPKKTERGSVPQAAYHAPAIQCPMGLRSVF